eukprot:TRINITY_DN9979_c0_g1_i1.p1 TRINITY_DN9979_c0_g1~~TRINITY_DN9979_c0_g1_i1.p1  ORF type:complete len:811 (+),score=125.63 TRINITY_DN9979_c0_g1_i1:40-2472(+)
MNDDQLSDNGSFDNEVRLHEGEWRGEEKEHWCSGEGHVEGMHCEHGGDMIEAEHWSCCGSLEFDGPCGIQQGTTRSSTPISHESDEMTMYIFETERWFPIVGWGQKRLPTDIPEWHNQNRKSVDRHNVRLPAGCIWASSWSIDSSRGDSEGWEYSGNWNWKYHHTRRKTDMVRRRRWKRTYHKEKEVDVTIHRNTNEPLGAIFKDRIIIKAEGVSAALSDFLGWRLVNIDDGPIITDDSQISEHIKNKTTIKATLEAIPTPDLHFLPEEPFRSHRCFTILKGRKQHGLFFMGSTHASFVTSPFKSFILFQWRNCTKADKQMAWKGQSIKFVIKDDNGEKKEYLLEGFDAKDNVYGGVKELAPACGRGRTASRSSAASFDESGSEYDGGMRAFRTLSSANKTVPSLQSENPGSPLTPTTIPSLEVSVSDMNNLFSRLPPDVAKHFLNETHIAHVIHDTVNIPGTSIPEVFDILFSNDSKFLSSYHTKRGEYQGTKEKPTPIVIPQWELLSPDVGYRSFECTTIVQAPWNKHTRFVEWQRYVKSENKLLVHFTSQTPDVMTGDCFRIEVLLEVTQQKGSCDLKILSEIHFLKSTWIRSKIQSTAIGELVVTYRQFVAQAREALSSGKRHSSFSSTKSSSSLSGGTKKKIEDSPIENTTTAVQPFPADRMSIFELMPSASTVAGLSQRSMSFLSNMGMLNGIALVLLLYSVLCIWAVVTSITTAIQGYMDLSGALSTAARCSNDPLCNKTTAGENLVRLLEASGGTDASLSLTFNTISLAVVNLQLVALLIFSFLLAAAIAFLLHTKLLRNVA